MAKVVRTTAAGEIDPAVRKSILTTLFISLLLDLVRFPHHLSLALADEHSCRSR